MNYDAVIRADDASSDSETWNSQCASQRAYRVSAENIELTAEGSRSVQRTDTDLAESARHVLSWTSSLPMGAVKVSVEGGWLTLSGDVEWQSQRQDAADSVRHLPGLSGITNQIVTKPAISAGIVKSHIGAALRSPPMAEAKTVGAEVSGADMILTETGHPCPELELAMRSASGSVGVPQVVDTTSFAA